MKRTIKLSMSPNMQPSVKASVKRRQLAQTLARLARIPGAIAQDRVDTVVHDILKKLKIGRPVDLPGLGKLIVIPTTKRTQRGQDSDRIRGLPERRPENTKRTQRGPSGVMNRTPKVTRTD
jgi:nucleoid DNA-binding protein